MSRFALGVFLVSTTMIALLAILFLDRTLAEFVHHSGIENKLLFVQGTVLLDLITGKAVSILLPSLPLMLAGVLMIAWTPTRDYGVMLLFVSVVHVLSYLICYQAKGVFGRLRPYQLLSQGGWDQAWYGGGDSFPSGHTAFYFGLFLPLAFLFPRRGRYLLVVPFFIATARIVESRHFLSDVTTSMAVVSLVVLAGIAVMDRYKLLPSKYLHQ